MKNRLPDLKVHFDVATEETSMEEDGASNSTSKIAINPTTKNGKFMEQFFKQVDSLRNSIALIEQLIGRLSAAHKRMLAEPEASAQDTNNIENLNDNIRTESSIVRKSLKLMENEIYKLESINGDQMTADLRIKKSQHSTLSRKFIDVMTSLNKTQNEYRDGCKSRIKRQLELNGTLTDNNQLEELIRSDNPNVFNQQLVAVNVDLKKALTEVEMRHQEILKLERSLQQLHDLFLDMARLVEQQGETIDRIENNVELSCQLVTAAKDETRKALQYKSEAMRKRFVCVGLLAIIVVVIVVLILVV